MIIETDKAVFNLSWTELNEDLSNLDDTDGFLVEPVHLKELIEKYVNLYRDDFLPVDDDCFEIPEPVLYQEIVRLPKASPVLIKSSEIRWLIEKYVNKEI